MSTHFLITHVIEIFKIHTKKEEYLYKIVDEKTIEVDLNNTKEQIKIKKLDSKELTLNFIGEEYQFFNELYRPADWFSEGYFCTCEKCMTELNGYDKLQGMELLKSNLNRKRMSLSRVTFIKQYKGIYDSR